jgi:hypothetical protein
MNTLDLAQKREKLRKVSGTNGGEWQGPCPGCGGEDRFHVWPQQNQGQGSYWCRGCGKGGDAIQFLRDFEGMSYHDACAYLNIDMPDRPEHATLRQPREQKQGFIPARHVPPAELWQEKAEKLTAWAQEHLMTNAEVLAWLAARGIDRTAAENYRLGWNPGEDGKDIFRARPAWGLSEIRKENGRLRALWIPQGLVIPLIIDGIVHRIRIRRPEGEPRYYVVPGSSANTMHLEASRRATVIVEAELDAIAIAAGTALAGAVAVGTSHGKPDAAVYENLKTCLQILVALDFDHAGTCAMKWWSEHFDNCDRWPVPRGKDPGEAFQMGIDLEAWIKAGLPPALTIGGQEPRISIQNSGVRRQKSGEKRSQNPETENLKLDTDGLPSAVLELDMLLKTNPSVKIINTPRRYTVLRNGKYVGGRINQLVFLNQEVRDYIMNHPAAEITGENLI